MGIDFALTLAIFVLGFITLILSIVVSFKFNKYRKILEGKPRALSNAISWQLAGEAVMGLGTLIFSIAAFLGVLQDWDIRLQSIIRLTMFFATGITTIHLHRTLKSMGAKWIS